MAVVLPIRLSQYPDTIQSFSASLPMGTAARPSGLLGIDTRCEIADAYVEPQLPRRLDGQEVNELPMPQTRPCVSHSHHP